MTARPIATPLLAAGLLAGVTVTVAAPASATVHEITGMLCAIAQGNGSETLGSPPGISGENGSSDRGELNLARPLFATGFATFDPTGGPEGMGLISFDENHPASKINLTGGFFPIGGGVYVTAFEFTRGGWQNCLKG